MCKPYMALLNLIIIILAYTLTSIKATEFRYVLISEPSLSSGDMIISAL